MVLPKYAKLEVERRFLVDPSKLPPLDPTQVRVIDDFYLEGGRLRLRSVASSDADPVYKLCKKYGAAALGEEPIVNIYLSAQEHAALATLPGFRLCKRRLYLVEVAFSLVLIYLKERWRDWFSPKSKRLP